MFISDIELDTRDKVLFGDDEKGVKVSIKRARNIEIEDIERQLSRLELGQSIQLKLKYIGLENLRDLARKERKK